MNDPSFTTGSTPFDGRADVRDVAMAAPASLVNRTHRVVRERARTQSDQRRRLRSLWLPLGICCTLLILLATGAWTVLAQNDLSPTGIPDASNQMLVFFLWFFPVSGALLALVWFRRSWSMPGGESAQ